MKDQDRFFQKILGAYTVAPADEMDMQKTILAGKQLLMKNPVQELRWYRRIVNQFKYISPAFVVFSIIGDWDMYAAY